MQYSKQGCNNNKNFVCCMEVPSELKIAFARTHNNSQLFIYNHIHTPDLDMTTYARVKKMTERFCIVIPKSDLT